MAIHALRHNGRRLGGAFAGLVLLFAPGCSTPLTRQACKLAPVETEWVRVEAREIRRGARGGVITLALTNLHADTLESGHGAKVVIQRADASTVRPVDMRAFEQLVEAHGPIAFGFENWAKTVPAVMLDPLGASLNLKTDEEALLHVAFEEPRSTRQLTLDLAPALVWRGADGGAVESATPILVAIPLPDPPSDVLPSRDVWRNFHVGVGVSSDDVIR